jgi:hypothetical protein
VVQRVVVLQLPTLLDGDRDRLFDRNATLKNCLDFCFNSEFELIFSCECDGRVDANRLDKVENVDEADDCDLSLELVMQVALLIGCLSC